LMLPDNDKMINGGGSEQQQQQQQQQLASVETTIATVTTITRDSLLERKKIKLLQDTLEFLEKSGFLYCISEVPSFVYVFQNELISTTIYDLLPPSEASKIHISIANFIENEYHETLRPFYSKLAYHYKLGSDRSNACKYEVKAAALLASSGAFQDGYAKVENAIELASNVEEFDALLIVCDKALEELQFMIDRLQTAIVHINQDLEHLHEMPATQQQATLVESNKIIHRLSFSLYNFLTALNGNGSGATSGPSTTGVSTVSDSNPDRKNPQDKGKRFVSFFGIASRSKSLSQNVIGDTPNTASHQQTSPGAMQTELTLASEPVETIAPNTPAFALPLSRINNSQSPAESDISIFEPNQTPLSDKLASSADRKILPKDSMLYLDGEEYVEDNEEEEKEKKEFKVSLLESKKHELSLRQGQVKSFQSLRRKVETYRTYQIRRSLNGSSLGSSLGSQVIPFSPNHNHHLNMAVRTAPPSPSKHRIAANGEEYSDNYEAFLQEAALQELMSAPSDNQIEQVDKNATIALSWKVSFIDRPSEVDDVYPPIKELRDSELTRTALEDNSQGGDSSNKTSNARSFSYRSRISSEGRTSYIADNAGCRCVIQ
jgi:hypothetical protein